MCVCVCSSVYLYINNAYMGNPYFPLKKLRLVISVSLQLFYKYAIGKSAAPYHRTPAVYT